MDIKDQIRITEELLEGVKELNGEYQEGWENNILEAENLLKHLKQVKNNDLLHSVSGIRPSNPTPTNKVDVHAEALYKGGQMLMAVKHIYNNTSMSIKDAKKYVDTNYR